MYKLSIMGSSLNDLEPKQKMLLSILCNLEIANNSFEMFLGKTINQPDLSNSKSLCSLVMGISSLYEALKRFDLLNKHIKIDENFIESIKDGMDLFKVKRSKTI